MYVCICLALAENALLLHVYRESCFVYMFMILSNCFKKLHAHTHIQTHRYRHSKCIYVKTKVDNDSVHLIRFRFTHHFSIVLYLLFFRCLSLSLSLLMFPTRSVSCTYTPPPIMHICISFHTPFIYIPYAIYMYTMFILSVNLFIVFPCLALVCCQLVVDPST